VDDIDLDYDFDVLGDATDDMLSSKTAFQLGTPTLSLPTTLPASPEQYGPPLSAMPSAPEQYGPPISAMASPAPQSTASKLMSAGTAALASYQKSKQHAVAPKAPPSFMAQEAFLGMSWGTVFIAGGAVLAIGGLTAFLVHKARE
jgi:hypothetical protein